MSHNLIIPRHRQNKFMTWLAAILLFLLLYPYFSWPFAGLFQWVVLVPLYLIFFLNNNLQNNKRITFFILFLLLTLLIGILNNQSVFALFFTVAVSITYAVSEDFIISVYRRFRKIYVVLIGLSILTYIFVALGVSLPHINLPALNPLKNYTYIAYPFLVVENFSSIATITRFCGLFDEPGVVGTISFILLYIEKFNFRRSGNLILLVSGIISLSLFFYIGLALYCIYMIFNRRIRIMHRFLFIIFLVGGILLITQHPVLNEAVFERMKWDAEAKTISGDNRAHEDLKDYMKSIRGTNQYYFGGNSLSTIEKYSGSASLQNAVLKYGLLPVLLYLIFYSFYSASYLHRPHKVLIFMIVLFLILYNRPTMFNISRQFLYNMIIFSYAGLYSGHIEKN